jgi:hypothetical protein
MEFALGKYFDRKLITIIHSHTHTNVPCQHITSGVGMRGQKA